MIRILADGVHTDMDATIGRSGDYRWFCATQYKGRHGIQALLPGFGGPRHMVSSIAA